MAFWTEIYRFYFQPSYPLRGLKKRSILSALVGALIFTWLIGSVVDAIDKDDAFSASQAESGQEFWARVLVVLIIAPIVEELAFRLFLGRFVRVKFIVSFSLLMSYAIVLATQVQGGQLDYYLHNYSLLIGVFVVNFTCSLLVGNYFRRLAGIWNRNTQVSIHLSSLLFSVFHLWGLSFLSPFILILNFISHYFFSLVAAFLRIRFGFSYAVIFHIGMNLPAVLSMILFLYSLKLLDL